MPFLLVSPPPPPPPLPCHPTPKTSPNLPSFSISAFSTKPVSLNSVHNYGFLFLSHVRSSKTTADMDEAEEERADFTKLRQKMDSHAVKIDSCTPGLYDLLVCPKVLKNLGQLNSEMPLAELNHMNHRILIDEFRDGVNFFVN